MESEDINSVMSGYTKAHLTKIKLQAQTDPSNIKVANLIQETLKMGKSMDMAFTNGPTIQFMKAGTKTIKRTGMANLCSRMEKYSKESGRKEKEMEKEF